MLFLRGKGRLQFIEIAEAEIRGLKYRGAHRFHGQIVFPQMVKNERGIVRVCHGFPNYSGNTGKSQATVHP